MSQKDSSPSEILNLLSIIPEEQLSKLQKRRENWEERNKELFVHNKRFNEIKYKMNDGSAFSGMTLDSLCSDMAFLSSFYDHVVEFEGIVVSQHALYTRYWTDNISIITSSDMFTGNKQEIQAQALRFIPELKHMWEILSQSEYELAALGLESQKQTPRAESIKMMIEVYKKRHDSKRMYGDSSRARV